MATTAKDATKFSEVIMDNFKSSTDVNETKPSQYVNSFGMTVYNINAMLKQDINMDKFETSSSSSHDKEDEIDIKYHKKIHYLHSGLGHCLKQININEDEQRKGRDTSDEEVEIEDENYQKLQRLHSGIGHFLGQMNIRDDVSKNIKTVEKIGGLSINEKDGEILKQKQQKHEVTKENICKDGAQDLDIRESVVSKLLNGITNMLSWFLPRQTMQLNYQGDNPLCYKQPLNEPFTPKSRIQKNKSTRLRSHPYKQSPRMHNLIGPTILVPDLPQSPKSGLRPIVIDGSNVAMCHGRALAKGKRAKFSSRGIEMCVEFFKRRGHSSIVAFLPQHAMSFSPDVLGRMEREGHVVFTPSRRVGGMRVASYDDRFIVEYAHHHGGVIVTRDNYADIYNENPDWRKTIEEMVLMPTWVGDTLMFPADPLGISGPTLDQLLRN